MRGLSCETCLVYLDDIIIITRQTCEKHLRNARKVLEKLKIINLKLYPFKYNLFRHESSYLGHVKSAEDVRLDSKKIYTVANGIARKISINCEVSGILHLL